MFPVTSNMLSWPGLRQYECCLPRATKAWHPTKCSWFPIRLAARFFWLSKHELPDRRVFRKKHSEGDRTTNRDVGGKRRDYPAWCRLPRTGDIQALFVAVRKVP